MRLAVGELARGEDDQFEIPLHVLVPSDGLAFLPGQGEASARVEIVVRAREAASGELVERSEVMTATRPTEDAALAGFTVDLDLPEGVYVLGVALRDLATGETSVVSTTVSVQDV
jgi:hypothetical protein